MAIIGLILIILSWVIQLVNKGKNIKTNFVLVYVMGAAFLATDGYLNGLTTLAVLNLVTLIVALAVFFKIRK